VEFHWTKFSLLLHEVDLLYGARIRAWPEVLSTHALMVAPAAEPAATTSANTVKRQVNAHKSNAPGAALLRECCVPTIRVAPEDRLTTVNP
jgi:hypothetical protein